MGSSIVHWAASSAITRPGGKHLALQDKKVQIYWFGVRGMKWEQFDTLFYSKLGSNPAPKYLIVQLGSNDLGILPGFELFNRIKCSFLRCKLLSPDTTIIWSDILPRLYWHNAKSAARVDSMRKVVNRKVKNFLKPEGGLVIRHPTITYNDKQLFRYDGTHLNDLGNAVLLNDFQGGLETFLFDPKQGINVFPDDLQTE